LTANETPTLRDEYSRAAEILDAEYKPAYTVPRSVEQKLQQSKEIVRLMDIGVLEEDYSSEWASPSFEINKKYREAAIRVVTDFRKNNTQLIVETSPISYSKDWGYDTFNGRIYVCFSIGLKYGLLSYQNRF
jgi:hypothetical protein